MSAAMERRRAEDREIVDALARLDERWRSVVTRLVRIESKLDVSDDLRVKVAGLEVRGKITYLLLAMIIASIVGLAFSDLIR